MPCSTLLHLGDIRRKLVNRIKCKWWNIMEAGISVIKSGRRRLFDLTYWALTTSMAAQLMAYSKWKSCLKTDLKTLSSTSCMRSTVRILNGLHPRDPRMSANIFLMIILDSYRSDDLRNTYKGWYKRQILQIMLRDCAFDGRSILIDYVTCTSYLILEILMNLGSSCSKISQ